MTCTKSKHPERESMSSAVEASGYVRRMVENEARGWGDVSPAVSRLGVKYGVPFWTLNNLRTGRAKTVEASVYRKIKSAFADQCRRHAARLIHEADAAMAVNPNDDVAALQDEIRALASRLEAATNRQRR